MDTSDTKHSNPFIGKPLRCVYDHENKKWWFSAVDVCAIFTGKSYEQARRYWGRLKCEQTINQVTRKSSQLKMPGADGKYYFTEVLDLKEVIYLLQAIPSPKANPFRLWLAEVVANSTNVEAMLVEAGREDARQIEERVRSANDCYFLQTVVRENIPL